jgi:uncharacterized protein (DUF1330 family)
VDDLDLDELIRFYEPDDVTATDRWQALFDPAAGGPITLINHFTLRDRAAYGDDTEATGLEAFLSYAAVSVPALAKVGGRFLVSSPVVTSLFGRPDPTHFVAVGWYPDRAALLALLRDPEYRAAFAHRRAAVASQCVIAASA